MHTDDLIITKIRTGLYHTVKVVISSLSTHDTKINEIGGLTEKWLYHLVPSLEGGASPTKVDEVPRNRNIIRKLVRPIENTQKEMAGNISELNTANLSTTVFLQGLMSVIVHPHWRNYTPLPHTAHLLMGSMVSLIVLFAGMANIWVIGCFNR